MCYVPHSYSGDLLGGGGGVFNFFELMEVYTPVWRHFLIQLVVPFLSVIIFMLCLLFSAAAGGVVCHGLVSLILVPQDLYDRRLRVEMVVFPTDPLPGVQGGVETSATGCVSEQKRDFHAIRLPRSCGESVLCA